MIAQLLGFLMKSKGVKFGVGALGGSGIIALILGLNVGVKADLNMQEVRLKEYVQLVIAPIKTEIKNLKVNVDNTNTKVNAIHEYLLKNK